LTLVHTRVYSCVMSHLYILKGKKIVPIDDVLEWGRWFEKANRRVDETILPDGKRVSTVFFGTDYYFGPKEDREPILFETMVFSEKLETVKLGKRKRKIHPDLDVERYSTWEEAEKGHKEMVKKWT